MVGFQDFLGADEKAFLEMGLTNFKIILYSTNSENKTFFSILGALI